MTAAAPAAPTVQVEGLTRRFGDNLALAPLDLELGPGITGLLGPNGSGKSTFMRCLVGLVRPDAGRAVIDGAPLEGDGLAVRKRVTYAPGEMHLYGELKASDQLSWLLRGRSRAARSRAVELANQMELPLEGRVRGYSHGMKRQLSLAAALAPEVQVRILDEPSEGLDPTKRSQVLDLLRADASQGRTILLSSHHLGEVDAACERIVFLAKGRLIADESATSVRQRAERLVHVEYADEADARRAAEHLANQGLERAEVRGSRLVGLLASRDPRPFLAAVGAASELPEPLAVEHGRLSLSELYRDLYGVEGT